MLGKTFKRLTDKMLAWQTRELQRFAVASDAYMVYARPRLVAEIALNDRVAAPACGAPISGGLPDGARIASPACCFAAAI